MTNKIMVAAFIAGYAHENQTRIGGEPYINHPMEVSYILRELCPNSFSEETLNDLTVAALLHDTVEDQEPRLREALINYLKQEEVEATEYQDVETFSLLKMVFGSTVSNTVEAVTNDPATDDKTLSREERLDIYLKGLRETLIEHADMYSFILKLSDFTHNAGNLSPKMKNLKKRYSSAFPIFEESYSLLKDGFDEKDNRAIEAQLEELKDKLL